MGQQAETKERFWTYLLVPAVAMALYIGGTNLYWLVAGRDDAVKEKTVLETHLTDADMPAVAALVAAMWQGTPITSLKIPDTLKQENHGVYAASRHRGRLTGDGWRNSRTQLDGLRDAINSARTRTPSSLRPSIDTIEFCIAHSYRDIRVGGKRKQGDEHVGIRGIYLRMNQYRERVTPLQMIAQNSDFEDAVKEFQRSHKLVDDDLIQNTTAESFECDQVLVFLGDEPRAVRMLRGNQVVPQKKVNQRSVAELAVGLEDWLARQVHPDGRMTYRYFPSKSQEDRGNKHDSPVDGDHRLEQLGAPAARQLHVRPGLSATFATTCPSSTGRKTASASSNTGGRSSSAPSRWRPSPSSPTRTAPPSPRTSSRCCAPSTFCISPAARCIPSTSPRIASARIRTSTRARPSFCGAHLYRENRDPKLLAKFMKSFEYYEEWHLKGYDKKGKPNRNPAFVPWHTQAYYMVWEITKDEKLRNFVYEMNDWLLSMQQWESAPYPDVRGAFTTRAGATSACRTRRRPACISRGSSMPSRWPATWATRSAKSATAWPLRAGCGR